MLRGADSTGSNSTGADQKLAPSEKSSTDIYLPAARSADFSISGVGTLSLHFPDHRVFSICLGVEQLEEAKLAIASGNRSYQLYN